MTELYLYQTVHLARGRARNAEAHAAQLDAASRELFGRGYAPARLAARIEALAAAERYPTGVSGFVRIELGADGEERLTPAGVSLYDGYALRSLQPEAVTLRYDLPLTEAPTSAREAAAQLARRMAERAGADVAVRCDREGILREADDAPLFAVAGHTVLAAPGTQSVERELAVRAVPPPIPLEGWGPRGWSCARSLSDAESCRGSTNSSSPTTGASPPSHAATGSR